MYKIPNRARKILKKIIDAGYEAYLVGGTARDLIYQKNTGEKRPIEDFDITTNATPDQIKQIFQGFRILNIGERHGTIMIRAMKATFDVTTYRVDGEYLDGRRPKDVVFVSSLKEDLARRDFTINAMALDMDGNLIDHYNGVSDLQHGVIRCVGDPIERFSEDYLRLLRAVRFAARFKFIIEQRTLAAIIKKSHELIGSGVSSERIYTELSKLMNQNARYGTLLLYETGLLKVIFPRTYQALLNLPVDPGEYLHEVMSEEERREYLHWAELFSALSVDGDSDYISRELKILKGLNKHVVQYVKIFVTKFGLTADLLEHKHSPNAIILWMNNVRLGFKTNKNEYWQILPKNLVAIVSKALNAIGRKVNSRTLTLAKEISGQQNDNYPFDGNFAKQLGFKGAGIRRILSFWQDLYLLGIAKTKHDFSHYADLLRNDICIEESVLAQDMFQQDLSTKLVKYLIELHVNNILSIGKILGVRYHIHRSSMVADAQGTESFECKLFLRYRKNR